MAEPATATTDHLAIECHPPKRAARAREVRLAPRLRYPIARAGRAGWGDLFGTLGQM